MLRSIAGLAGEGLSAVAATAAAAVQDVVSGASEDPLAERDPDYIRATLPGYKRVADVYFRPKVRGLENIPAEGPVLLVGNHSGGTLIADTFAFSYAFSTYFGPERRFHQLAHDMVFQIPGLGTIRKWGTVPANHENAERALAMGAALLVYPGGDHESYRPTADANKVDFGGRSGYVELALKAGVPIVPVVSVGGQETAFFLTRGQGAAKLLQLDRLFRIKVLPIQIAPPFGITVFDLPMRLPLPAQVTIQVLPPVDLAERFGKDPDRDEVSEALLADMQDALDVLAGERDLPVVGSVTPRPD